jgi:membrane associated rhomboid family serine protease
MSSSVFPNLKSYYRHGNLKCPECTALMIPFSCENAVIDKCPQCSGIWFDHREIGVFKQSLGKFDYSEFKLVVEPSEPASYHISHCPRCKDQVLDEIAYSYNAKVKTSKCEKCQGLWLPFKQLVNLMDMTRVGQLIQPHLRGLAEEIEKSRRNSAFYGQVKNFGDLLNTKIHPYRSWQSVGLLPIILPLYDTLERNIFPLVTVSLIFANLVIFYSKTFAFSLPVSAFIDYALIPAHLSEPAKWKTLFSHMFFHANNLHLIGNMFYLWLFGDNVEESLGTLRFVTLYLATGIIAAISYAFCFPSSDIPMIGASGAISGVLGSYLVLHPNATIRTMVFFTILDIPAWFILTAWFALQVICSYIPLLSRVAWEAHIAGFIAGVLFTYLLKYLHKVRNN